MKDLTKIFPLEPIPDCEQMQLTDFSGDDVEQDIQMLAGKRWDALQPSDFRFHFEVVCWLSPKAFCYYLPAIISCSLSESELKGALQDTELVVDYTLRMLMQSESTIVNERSEEMWKPFSVEQVTTIREWIAKIAKCPNALPSSSEDLLTTLDMRTKCNRPPGRL